MRREEIFQIQDQFSEVLNTLNESSGLFLASKKEEVERSFSSMVIYFPSFDEITPLNYMESQLSFSGPQLEIIQYYKCGISVLYQPAYFPAVGDKNVEEIYTEISSKQVTKKFVLKVLICFLEKILNNRLEA